MVCSVYAFASCGERMDICVCVCVCVCVCGFLDGCILLCLIRLLLELLIHIVDLILIRHWVSHGFRVS